MSKTDELKKLAEKLVGSAPDTRRASNVVEYIADNLGGDTEDTDTISEAISYLTDVYTPIETQEKDVTITENGETEITADEGYNALSKVNVTTNVGSNVKITDGTYFFYLGARFNDYNNIKEMFGSLTLAEHMFEQCNQQVNLTCDVDTHLVTNFNRMFYYTNFTKIIANIDTSAGTVFSSMFMMNSSATEIDVSNFDTSHGTNFQNMFTNCSALVNLNIEDFNFSSWNANTATQMKLFNGTENLSNDSLHSIIKALLTATNVNSSVRKLSNLGLTSTQATTCTSFDEWATLVANGWTTGY